MKKSYLIITIVLLTACENNKTTQIGENTFVQGSKVYKLMDNELVRIADTESKDSSRIQPKNLGSASISYIKKDATAELNILYRGNILYFKLKIIGINDLKDNFSSGQFQIEFIDQYGFILQTTPIQSNEFTGIVGNDNKVTYFEYNGKTEMTSTMFNAISNFSVSSSVTAID